MERMALSISYEHIRYIENVLHGSSRVNVNRIFCPQTTKLFSLFGLLLSFKFVWKPIAIVYQRLNAQDRLYFDDIVLC